MLEKLGTYILLKGAEKHTRRMTSLGNNVLSGEHRYYSERLSYWKQASSDSLRNTICINLATIPLSLITGNIGFLSFGALQAVQGILVEIHTLGIRQRYLASDLLMRDRGLV